MRIRRYVLLAIWSIWAASVFAQDSGPKLPYHGFNLLEKFDLNWSNGPFLEEDFRMIHDLGFNFVRLPMDYRTWIKNGNWKEFDEESLKQIDQAVAWGSKYKIHVSINFHRAPGYTVAQPPEPTSIWTDASTLQVCALHWETFARRYRNVPPENLSFNLFNEPSGVDAARYKEVVQTLIRAIRKYDRTRPIYLDGLDYARIPVTIDTDEAVRVSLHQYDPMSLTHYKASWISGSDTWPVPQWPVQIVPQYLYGNQKKDLQSPLEIRGEFPAKTKVRIRVATVSAFSKLVCETENSVVAQREFRPGPGAGEWKKSLFQKQWQIWQNEYDLDWKFEIKQNAKILKWTNVEGDWMTVSEIGIDVGDGHGEYVLMVTDPNWGVKQTPIEFDRRNSIQPFRSSNRYDAEELKNQLEKALATVPSRTNVMIQECGAFNQTPHSVVLAWFSDQLALWKQKKLGWALWNFRGSFGILDSGRTDVKYEDYHGHKLDRALLSLLQNAIQP